MRKLDILAFLGEFFSMDAFNETIINYSSKSILLNYNKYKLWFSYIPENIKIKKRDINLYITKSERLNYYISPFILLVNNAILFRQMLKMCWQFRPRVVIVDGFILPILAGILKKCKLCEKSVYITGDWHPANKRRDRLISYFGNIFVFPYLDYLSCKSSDVVLNYSDEIAKARYKYWNKRITKREKTIYFPLKISTDKTGLEKKNKKIGFIGILREDSGLDIVIRSLSKLREVNSFSLKIIGAHSHDYEHFRNLAKRYQVDKYVEFLGFVKRGEFEENLSDCFCGINLVLGKGSYTSYTYPGKIGDYLQYLLPIIATENIGYAKKIIRNNRLGIITTPTEDKFIDALIKVYKEQKQYRKNIIEYINAIPRINIKELIEL